MASTGASDGWAALFRLPRARGVQQRTHVRQLLIHRLSEFHVRAHGSISGHLGTTGLRASLQLVNQLNDFEASRSHAALLQSFQPDSRGAHSASRTLDHPPQSQSGTPGR